MSHRSADSALLGECLQELAKKYPQTKFLKIISTECIPNYPDKNLPTVLIYKDTKCVQHLIGLAQFGGRRLTPERKCSHRRMAFCEAPAHVMPLKALDVLQRSPYPSTGLDLCVDMKGTQKPLFQCKTYGYVLCDHHAIVVIWQASESPCYRLRFADLLMTFWLCRN